MTVATQFNFSSMQTQHTQGVWQITSPDGGGDFDIIVAQQGTENSDMKEIASVCPNREEKDANARLIAAAPDLLAALQNLVRNGLIKDTDGDHYDEVLDAIDLATN